MEELEGERINLEVGLNLERVRMEIEVEEEEEHQEMQGIVKEKNMAIREEMKMKMTMMMYQIPEGDKESLEIMRLMVEVDHDLVIDPQRTTLIEKEVRVETEVALGVQIEMEVLIIDQSKMTQMKMNEDEMENESPIREEATREMMDEQVERMPDEKLSMTQEETEFTMRMIVMMM
jgi:hypothetical protein